MRLNTGDPIPTIRKGADGFRFSRGILKKYPVNPRVRLKTRNVNRILVVNPRSYFFINRSHRKTTPSAKARIKTNTAASSQYHIWNREGMKTITSTKVEKFSLIRFINSFMTNSLVRHRSFAPATGRNTDRYNH